MQMPTVPEWVTNYISEGNLWRVAMVAVGLIVVIILVHIAHRSINRYVSGSGTRYRARKVATFIGYFMLLLFIAAVFSEQLGGVTIAFGVAGAGVAFALQEVITSIAGWLALTFGDYFAVGDRVRLGSTFGDVIDVGVLRTTIMECGEWVSGDNYNGRTVLVPNSFVFKEPVFNYSANFPFLWDEITVPVRYGGDRVLAREIIRESVESAIGDYVEEAREHWDQMTRKYLIEQASVEAGVWMQATDNWLEFTARYVVDYKRRRSTRDQIFRTLLEKIEQTDGAVQLASATHEIVDLPTLDVRTRPDQSP